MLLFLTIPQFPPLLYQDVPVYFSSTFLQQAVYHIVRKRVENDTCCTLQIQFAETLQDVEYNDLTLLNKKAPLFSSSIIIISITNLIFVMRRLTLTSSVVCCLELFSNKQAFLQINPVHLETKPHLEIICQQYTSHCLTGNDSFLQSFMFHLAIELSLFFAIGRGPWLIKCTHLHPRQPLALQAADVYQIRTGVVTCNLSFSE